MVGGIGTGWWLKDWRLEHMPGEGECARPVGRFGQRCSAFDIYLLVFKVTFEEKSCCF